jgi:hypothetical protein
LSNAREFIYRHGLEIAVAIALLIGSLAIIGIVLLSRPVQPIAKQQLQRISAPEPAPDVVIPKTIRVIPITPPQPVPPPQPAVEPRLIEEPAPPAAKAKAKTKIVREDNICERVHRHKEYYNNGKSWRCVR